MPLRSAYRKLVPRTLRRRLALSGRLERASSHLGSIWPRLTDASVRGLVERLEDLRDAYAGERCVIMGSGPSLNRMDLEAFRHEHVWGVNRCNLLFPRLSWRPRFYVAVDRRVVPDIAADIQEMACSLSKTNFFLPVSFRYDGTLGSRPNIYWFREIPLPARLDRDHSFTSDAASGVFAVRTVTIAALQLAVHLGFNPVYLIGCDTSYSVPSSVVRDTSDPDRLVSTRDDDQNHFDRGYFGRGSKWHEPHVERMIEHYRLAKIACDELGVEVYDATVDGRLEVFPKVSYESVFSPSQ